MTGRTHDHELMIGSTTSRWRLIRDDDDKVMYSVTEEPQQFQPKLTFEQTNWINGHGHYMTDDPQGYLEGQSIDTTQDGRIILGPLINEVYGSASAALESAPVMIFWSAIAGVLLCATTSRVYVYGSSWLESTTTGVAGVINFAEFNGYIFASRGAGTAYCYSTDGQTWTNSTLTDGTANRFFKAPNTAGTADILWKSGTLNGTSTDVNELKSNTSGINGGAQWSTAAYIGDTTADINNIFLVNDNLMIGKEDNLWHYDSAGGIHPLMDDLKTSVSTRNFQYVTKWQSGVYFSRGNSLGELTSYNTFSPIGPLEKTIDIGKTGFCTGLTSDTNYVFAAWDEGTNIHIYKGREYRTANGLVWQWCPIIFIGTNACTTMTVAQHSATDRRLWFGYGTHTGWVQLTDNPTADSTARFAASGWLRMSYYYGTNIYWDKLFDRLITETKGCTANRTVTPAYRKDTETWDTNLTAAVTTETSQEILLESAVTADTDLTAAITANGITQTDFTSLVSCKKISFKVTLATNDSTLTPEVLMFRAVGVEKPEAIRVHDCVYAIGSDPSNQAETLRSSLRTARTSVALVRFADLRYGEYVSGSSGVDYAYVVCQAGYPQEIEVQHEKGRSPELGIKVRWEEVGNTVVDDWGYYYSDTEDIFQAVYNEGSSALFFIAV